MPTEDAAKPSRGSCTRGRTSLYSGLLTIHGRHAPRIRPPRGLRALQLR